MVYYDIIDQIKDVSIYQKKFLLWKTQWDAYTDPQTPLNWKCVKFEKDNKSQIPTKKGVYAFFIEPRIAKFPSHAYLTYIGEAGHESDGNLQKRFEDYLQEKRRPKRIHIYHMLNTWEDYLYFYYAEVNPIQTDLTLKQLEERLLDTFTPPFSKRGYSAKIGEIIRGLE